jgi:hypothetical protein
MRKLTIAATLAFAIAAAAETQAATAFRSSANPSIDGRDRSPIFRIIRVIKRMWNATASSLPTVPIP